jgi:opacity protein-like surface antigen
MDVRARNSVILCIAILSFSNITSAQPTITDPPLSGDWENFTVTASNNIAFEFTVPTIRQQSYIRIDAPADQMIFAITKSGVSCNINGASTLCGGVTVNVIPDNPSGPTAWDINVVPDLDPSVPVSSDPIRVLFKTQSEMVGSWTVHAPPPASPSDPPIDPNIDAQWVHAVEFDVDFPVEVISGQIGVELDASATTMAFKSKSGFSPPTLAYTFEKENPADDCPSPTPVGAKATFDAPAVTVEKNCEYRIGVVSSDAVGEIYNATKPAQILITLHNPVDAALLLDTSGSMGWHREGSLHDMQGLCCSRLAAAKVAASYFVNRLRTFTSTSRIGVAIFPGEPAPSLVYGKRWYPATQLAPVGDFSGVTSAIGETTGCPTSCASPPGSPMGAKTGIPINWNGTPTQAGLEAAKDMLVNPPTTGKSRIIVLLSDGAYNIGDVPEEHLSDFVAEGIHIYTIGIGTEGTDNVNFESLKAISINSGVGTAGHPIGFTEFSTDNPATDPNLIPHFEKILTDMVGLDFAADPVATISPGETNTHAVLVTDHDSLVSFTVSWESTSPDILDAYVVSPGGQKVEAQLSASGYKNITVNEELLRHSGDSPGEWKLVVRYPDSNTAANAAKLNYNYSVITKSALNMRVKVDKDEYFTGDAMLLEAVLIENNRRLKGGSVDVNVLRPEEGIGNWHFANIVAEKLLESVPNEISGEPLTQLDKKNFVLLQQMKIKVPQIITEPKVSLNDNGKDGDKYPNDGIYSGRFSGFSVPGVYRFRIAASGTAKNGQAYRRETEFQKYIDILPDANVTDKERAIEKVNPDGTSVMRISVTPFDAAKNYLGPGYADKIEIKSSIGEPTGEVRDMLYGAYERKFRISAADITANPNIKIKVKGVIVNDGPIKIKPPTYKWEISGHLGYAFPQGNLSNNFDGGFSGMLDLARHFNRSWSAEALLGHHRFGNKGGGNDFSWTHVSLNGKYSYPVGLFRVFANGGGGWYVPESGDSGFGWNAGAGINYPRSERLWIDLGYNYHHVSKGDRNEFSNLSLGIRYGFK